MRFFKPGEQIGGYLLEELLGGGGFGQVWKATSSHGTVALKILNPATGNAAQAYEMFRRERDASDRIDSGRVARVVDSHLSGELCFIAFPLIPGADLDEHIRRQEQGYLLTGEALTIFLDVARGLDAIHRAGIFHRDIKPANIIVTPNGGAVIVDLGIAILGEGSDITRAGWGTNGYRAPEQELGTHASAALDVWSFGATVIKALTGHLPFPPADDPGEYHRRLSEPPDVAGCPAPLLSLMQRCLAVEPSQRPTASELVDRLRALLDRYQAQLELSGSDRAEKVFTTHFSPAQIYQVLDVVPTAYLAPRIVPLVTLRGRDGTEQRLLRDWTVDEVPTVGGLMAGTPRMRRNAWSWITPGVICFDNTEFVPPALHPDAPTRCPACDSPLRTQEQTLWCTAPEGCPAAGPAALRGILKVLCSVPHDAGLDLELHHVAEGLGARGIRDACDLLCCDDEVVAWLDESPQNVAGYLRAYRSSAARALDFAARISVKPDQVPLLRAWALSCPRNFDEADVSAAFDSLARPGQIRRSLRELALRRATWQAREHGDGQVTHVQALWELAQLARDTFARLDAQPWYSDTL